MSATFWVLVHAPTRRYVRDLRDERRPLTANPHEAVRWYRDGSAARYLERQPTELAHGIVVVEVRRA